MLEQYLHFMGLIIFGNIENLILSSQGVVQGVDPKVLGGLSIIAVIIDVIWIRFMVYSFFLDYIGHMGWMQFYQRIGLHH